MLYIYSHPPRIAVPPGWESDLLAFEREGVGAWPNLSMPKRRDQCLRDIKTARDKGHAGTRLPWIPYNCTNPLLDDEESTDEHYVDCIDSAQVVYSGVNAPGEFRATIHPKSYRPSLGWYITAFYSESNTDTGSLVFYGRITACHDTGTSIEITARDAVQNLIDKDQLSLNQMPFEQLIYYLSLLGGAYMYRETLIPDQYKGDMELWSHNLVYGSCLDGIVGLLDTWYALKLKRMYIRVDGGLIVLCDYSNPTEIDIIDASMVPVKTWALDTTMDSTYTSAAITYPVWTVEHTDVKSRITERIVLSETTPIPAAGVGTLTPSLGSNIHNGHLWNMRFKYPQGKTFTGTINGVLMEDISHAAEMVEKNRISLGRANQMAINVLKYHGYPTYTITLRQVTGILRLRPGMIIGVPYILNDDAAERYMALCVIRSITHTFKSNRYTMDITAEIDPYDQTVRPDVWRQFTDSNQIPKSYGDEMTAPSSWGDKVTLISYTGMDEMPVRLPLWLKETIQVYKDNTKPIAPEDVPGDDIEGRLADLQNRILVIEHTDWADNLPLHVTGEIGELAYRGSLYKVIVPSWQYGDTRYGTVLDCRVASDIVIKEEARYKPVFPPEYPHHHTAAVMIRNDQTHTYICFIVTRDSTQPSSSYMNYAAVITNKTKYNLTMRVYGRSDPVEASLGEGVHALSPSVYAAGKYVVRISGSAPRSPLIIPASMVL